MSRYRIAPAARDDLKEICRYIARDKPVAAGRLRATFYERFRRLAAQPFLGEAREDLARNLRCLPVGSYVIFYRPIPDAVEVVRLIHGARDIDAMF